MSLDVYLKSEKPFSTRGTGVYVRDAGKTKELTVAECIERWPDQTFAVRQRESDSYYHANITHNLNAMAEAAEIDITHAVQLVPLLAAGYAKLVESPATYEVHNPPNGWGSYECLVEFVGDYLKACITWPWVQVEVCR